MTSRSTSLGKTASSGTNCAKGASFLSLEINNFKGKHYLLVFRKTALKAGSIWGGHDVSSSLLSGQKSPFCNQSL